MITQKGWETLFSHLIKWLANLRRARQKRKQESIAALRDVIKVIRRTSVYLRSAQETNKRSNREELELSLQWTDLGFKLEDLGLTKLAKRCEIRGAQWADPSRYDGEFIKKADVSLESIEKLARMTLNEITR